MRILLLGNGVELTQSLNKGFTLGLWGNFEHKQSFSRLEKQHLLTYGSKCPANEKEVRCFCFFEAVSVDFNHILCFFIKEKASPLDKVPLLFRRSGKTGKRTAEKKA